MGAVLFANLLTLLSLACGVCILLSNVDDCDVMKDTYWAQIATSGSSKTYITLQYSCLEYGTGQTSTADLSDDCAKAGDSALSFSVFAAAAMIVTLVVGLRRQIKSIDSGKIIGVITSGASLACVIIAAISFEEGCVSDHDEESAIERGPAFGLAIVIVISTFTATLMYFFDSNRSAKIFFAGVASTLSPIMSAVLLASASDDCASLKDTAWAVFETRNRFYDDDYYLQLDDYHVSAATGEERYIGTQYYCQVSLTNAGFGDDTPNYEGVEEFHEDSDCREAGEVATGCITVALFFFVISFAITMNRMVFQNHKGSKIGWISSALAFIFLAAGFATFDRDCLESDELKGEMINESSETWEQTKSVGFALAIVILFTSFMQTLLAALEPATEAPNTDNYELPPAQAAAQGGAAPVPPVANSAV